MTIRVIMVGKTSQPYVREGLEVYLGRLVHYARVEWNELPDSRTRNTAADTLRLEAELILGRIRKEENVILLDEAGESLSSRQFAQWLQKRMNSGIRSLVLVVGGAHGFDPELKRRADGMLSLSSMTFPHDLVRLVLAEQLYRAFTILKGEHYHHD